MITAVGIKKLYYAEPEVVTADLTGALLKTIITGAVEVKNVHQDSWSLEESEPTTTRYKNQLTGLPYRQDTDMGDIQMSFTIGQYDYQTKADLMGGDVIMKGEKVVGWKRAASASEIRKCLIAQTKDDQWVVFPKGAVAARESNTDKAVGLAVVGVALDSSNLDVRSEYWFDDSEVVSPAPQE